jgi:hypothetical protein
MYVQVMRRRLKRLAGATVLTEKIDSHQCDWEMRFAYKGFEFEIRMYAADSQYFVNDPSCPDDLLCEVARHFDRDL